MSTLKFTSVPTKTLSQAILSSASTFIPSNITGWDGNDLTSADFGSIAFGAFINADRTVLEFFEWDPSTVASSAITMLNRGLTFTGANTTPVTANQLDWPAGTTIMLGSDVSQVYQWLKDYIDAIAIAGAPNATTILQGLVQLATQTQVDAGTATGSTGAKLVSTPDLQRGKAYNDYAVDSVGTDAYAITITPAITAYAAGQVFTFKAGTANTGAATLNVSGLGAKTIKKDVSSDLVTGDILANQIVIVEYDGTNMQLLSIPSGLVSTITNPTVRTYVFTSVGSSTTQFDITNPSGTTFRYTYDGTGTDPVINTTTFPTGSQVVLSSSSMTLANIGYFIVTGSGSNYFEITNAPGVAENNKTLTGGYLKVNKDVTWTKPTGLKYVIAEVQGGGGAGGRSNAGSTAGGGGAGGYAKKLILAATLGSTETITVGYGGRPANSAISTTPTNGGTSSIGSQISATGGTSIVNDSSTGVAGGTGTNGDINISGGNGGDANGTAQGGVGGSSALGSGGVAPFAGAGSAGTGYGSGSSGNDGTGSNGPTPNDGIVIITEFY